MMSTVGFFKVGGVVLNENDIKHDEKYKNLDELKKEHYLEYKKRLGLKEICKKSNLHVPVKELISEGLDLIDNYDDFDNEVLKFVYEKLDMIRLDTLRFFCNAKLDKDSDEFTYLHNISEFLAKIHESGCSVKENTSVVEGAEELLSYESGS